MPKGVLKRVVSLSMMIGVLWFSAWWTISIYRQVRQAEFAVLRTNLAQVAYDFLKDSDQMGEVLFPTYPLVHLLVENRLPSFASSVYDREVLAELPLSPLQKAEFPGDRVRTVYWPDKYPDMYQWGLQYVIPEYFGDFEARESDLEHFRKGTRPR
jgi:hypothetical protein